jgi:flagellar biosynthesis anti-sigma factor FlgM
MAIEIKPGTRSLATHYQTQHKNTAPANSDKFDAVLAEKLQTVDSSEVAAPAETIENADKVVFTNVIQEMRRRIDATSEQTIDTEKVARIRQAIENGTYIINPDRIAAKILGYAY